MNKMGAAEEHLDASIKLFFEGVSIASSFTLASASRRITDDLFKIGRPLFIDRQFKRGLKTSSIRFSFGEELEISIRPEFKKEGFKAFRRQENFLKHADQDPFDEIESISINLASLTIFTAITNISLIADRFSSPMSLFLSWFLANNPKFIREKCLHDPFIKQIRIFRDEISKMQFDQGMSFMYQALEIHCPELFNRSRMNASCTLGG